MTMTIRSREIVHVDKYVYCIYTGYGYGRLFWLALLFISVDDNLPRC